MEKTNKFIDVLQIMKKRALTYKISAKFLFIVMGIASTAWFLIRVIPKPQRAGYPCMRTAAPMMSGFVLYILSLGGLTMLFKKSVANFKKAKYWSGAFAFVLAAVLLVAFNIKDSENIFANSNAVAWTRGVLPDAPNTPMGTAFGIKPGRVVWSFNTAATNENCQNTINSKTISVPGETHPVSIMDWDNSDAYIMPKNNNQDTIDKMTDDAIKALTGTTTVSAAWDALFKNFNERKHGSATGYTAGQIIFIKVNNGQAGWAINSYDLSEKSNPSATGINNAAMANTSPFPVVAIIRQLVRECGIAQENIYVGEPMTHVYKSMYQAVHDSFPNVKILDKEDKTSLGRTQSTGWASDVIQYSDGGDVMPDAITNDLMNEMNDADYLINIPALKAHARGGVTLTAKNHFGSSTHGNTYGADPLHAGLINTNPKNDVIDASSRTNYGMYRVLTDIMGHEKIGGNTILYVMDALWGGIEATDMPVKWKTAPFNNDFPSSLLLAQDPVALESVCIDFLRAEAYVNTDFKDRPFFPAVDDHLHQSAEKANWPAGFVYDPEGDATPIASLGIHEHWNNPTNKQYSRNLFSNGTGIELVSIPASLVNNNGATANNLTLTVTSNSSALQDVLVTVNGSNFLTNAEGKVTIGNLTNTTGLSYTLKKDGYNTVTAQVEISGDTQETKEMETGTTPNSITPQIAINNLKVYPNPCTTETNLSYYLKEGSRVYISIVSISGKTLKIVKDGEAKAGNNKETIITSDLAPGIYFGVIKTTLLNNFDMRTVKFEVK